MRRPARSTSGQRRGAAAIAERPAEAVRYRRDLYAIRSALNEPSHSSSPTRTAIAVPVNDGFAGPRAISVTAIVFGSIVATMYPREHRIPASVFGAPPHAGSLSIIPAVI